MSQLPRRQLLAGGGVVLAPAVLAAQPVAAAQRSGELVTLLTPIWCSIHAATRALSADKSWSPGTL